MILSYLYSLGFSVILANDVSSYCHKPMNGCFVRDTKQIVVNVNTLNFRQTFFHEVGHALTDQDTELKELCEKTGKLNGYKRVHPDDYIYEFMADMYSKYHTEPETLKWRNPDIYNYFKNHKYYR